MGDRDISGGEASGPGDDEHARGNELTGAVFGASVQARSIQGNIQFNLPPQRAFTAPAQLRSGPTHFANRKAELRALGALLETRTETSSPALIVISGAGGVGKTTLALHWLHQVLEHFPDGQLYADLRGFSDTGVVEPGDALPGFIRALGTPAESIPSAEDERAALFRTLTAGRRLVMLLDNAATAAQVRSLLPGHGPTLVVVTSRLRLTGLALEGAQSVELGPLDENNALELLSRMLGNERVQKELKAARSLVELCARLPLALSASGAHLATRRRLSIRRVVEDLADETRRLSVLDRHVDVSVQAAFDISYNALPREAGRLYRLLGIHPGPDFGSEATAALAGIDIDEATELLDVLVDANLLEERSTDKLGFHDLLRLHARSKMMDTEPVEEHAAALARLARWYLKASVRADHTVLPGRWHLGEYYETYKAAPNPYEDRNQALDWLEAERDNLVAVAKAAHEQKLHESAWQICEAMWSLWIKRRHYGHWIRSYQIGFAAAGACRDIRAQARMLEGLSVASLSQGDFAAAIERGGQALQLERQADHPIGEAAALECLGNAELALNRPRPALAAFDRARLIHRRINRPRGVALMTRRIGEALRDAGDLDASMEHLSQAYRYFDDDGDDHHRAHILAGLAQVHFLTGHADAARAALDKALSISGEIGALPLKADVHGELARLAAWRGEQRSERHHLECALAIYRDLGAPQAAEIKNRLARNSTEHEQK